MRTQTFEKKANVPVKERFWPVFSSNNEHNKCQETLYKGLQGSLTTFVQMIRPFFWEIIGR